MHSRGDQMNPLEGGRRLAAEIPGAQLVTLESDNHVLLDGEPATDVCFAELAASSSRTPTRCAPAYPAKGPAPDRRRPSDAACSTG